MDRDRTQFPLLAWFLGDVCPIPPGSGSERGEAGGGRPPYLDCDSSAQ